ncbi:MAG: ATP-binding protein [Lachnospiraceae bacterium]|nr:ATP-binding protein [Lachnospiraceae bacterium]
MKELSLHILDIAENSVKAKASKIEIDITEDTAKNLLTIEIKDNGCGMSEEFLKKVKDPFSTTRTTRKVGMGLSLFESAAQQCDGKLEISSKEGVGTEVSVTFALNHIDRAPLGDMAGTMQTLVGGSPDIDFIYRHKKDGQEFLFDTAQIRETLSGVPLDTPEVILWIGDFINEGINELN